MCARYVGDQNKLGFQYESGTYAVASGTVAQSIGLVSNSEITESQNVESIRFLGAANRNVSQHVDGPLDVEGTLRKPAQRRN